MMIWINRSFEIGLIVSVWLLLDLVLIIFSEGNFDNAIIFNLFFIALILTPYVFWRKKDDERRKKNE